MAELYPEPSAWVAWFDYQYRIASLVKDKLTRKSGPDGFNKYGAEVVDKVKKYFLSNFSKCPWMEDLVQSRSAKVRSFTKTRKAPQSEAFWWEISIPSLVDSLVEDFVKSERKRLWEAHKAIVISNLNEALPAAVRPFESYYTEFFLSKFFLRQWDYWIPEGRETEQLEEWLKTDLKKVVTREFPKLINDKGELIDEELVRLATSGATHEAASVQLMERYTPKIKNLVAGIVYKHGLCPPSQDAPSFIEDTAQNVCLKIMANLESYGHEQPFEHWVARICNNESFAGHRDIVGRAKLPRVFVTWEEFLQQAPSPVIRNTEHRDILKKAIDKYIEQGGRAKKSWDAIRLKYFEDLDVEEIAVRLNTTEGYFRKMLSHDYRELRRIGLDDFGFSGTDL